MDRKTQKKSQSFFDSKDDYVEQLESAQKALLLLQQKIHRDSRKLVLVFEGHDAAGKGGVIKRLTERLDPRGVQVHAIGKPNVIESGQHYFERFFARLPAPGMITVFDRSWYGRVLVERVEGLCPPRAWKRAYEEIARIEKMLQDDGILILKFMLDLSYEEQGRRFAERRANPFKSWKLTDEDLRNRKKWKEYETAFRVLLKKTSTKHCPWRVIPSDSKWFARVAVANHVVVEGRKLF